MFKSDDELLCTLLDKVESFELQLPDFQRGWVWEDNRIKALLASLTLSYPVGAIMLLESGGDYNFKCKSIEGSGTATKEPEDMILDGQQRMTSTYMSMRCKKAVETRNDQGKNIKRFYYLDIDKALNTTVDREQAIISVDENKQIRSNIGRDIDLDLSTEEKEFQNKMIPFNRLTNSSEINEWRNKYQEYYNFDSEIIKQYQKVDQLIIQPILNYRIPIIKVLKDTPKEAVCQVFENVNTGGVPLNAFELLTASFAAENFDLKADWESIKKSLEVYPTLEGIDNISFLTAIVLLIQYKEKRTLSCKKKDLLNLQPKEYIKYKDYLIVGIKSMYDVLTELCIFTVDDIPYTTQLIPLAVICSILENNIHNAAIKQKIKQWYWCGVFGELYSSANETRYALDVPQVIDWINGSSTLPKTINDCSFSTTRLLTLQTRNSAAYKGINALILCNEAKDWISGNLMSITNYIDERSDIHHMFPRTYCEKNNLEKKKWNSVINKTPIFFVTNRFIGGDAPSKYFDRIVKNKGIGENDLDNYVTTHLANANLLKNDKFDEFIVDRAKQLLNAIEQNTGKKILDRNSQEIIDEFGQALI